MAIDLQENCKTLSVKKYVKTISQMVSLGPRKE